MTISVTDQKLLEYIKDYESFARDCLIVRDHNTGLLKPFVFRKAQRILHKVAEKQKAEKGRVRILNLKSRRYGGSTYVEGRFYWRSGLNKNRSTFIVAHEEDATSTLFRMAKLFHEKNPIPPQTLASSAQELRFDNKDGNGLKSEYRLATARNVHAGKSQGIHYLHISEEAQFQGDPEELLTSLFACVPKTGIDTEIYRESTAQGYGNTFQMDVFDAYADGKYPYYSEGGVTYAWENPTSDWILVFIPWFCVEMYTLDFENGEQRQQLELDLKKKVFDSEAMAWVENEASRLMRKYKLSPEQMNWRESCIATECRGSLDRFHQNYPATVEEAFLSQGTNFFNKELCDALESECLNPIVVGDVDRLVGRTRIKHNEYGPFRVWQKKIDEDSYFITVDCAGGKKKVDPKVKMKEPDKTNIDVWNHRTGLQVAQWNGHISYDLIGDLVCMIGELYGVKRGSKMELPVACVELNNHGYTVVADLSRDNYPQWKQENGEPGWVTNRRTKPQMVDSFKKAVRDAELIITCRETVSEMRTFIEDRGEFGAASGCNDDRVITGSIAAEIMKTLPRKFLDKKRRNVTEVRFKNVDRLSPNKSTERSTREVYYA